MRYLIWKLAQEVLPRAGRIVGSEGDIYTVNIGKSAGVEPDERFCVVRVTGAGENASKTMLPLQLEVIELFDTECKVAATSSGLEGLWDGDYVLEGDLVVRHDSADPLVAVTSPQLDGTLLPKHLHAKWNIFNAGQKENIKAQARTAGEEFANLLRAGLQHLHVNFAEAAAPLSTGSRSAAQQLPAATHEITARIAPLTFFRGEINYDLVVTVSQRHNNRKVELPKFTVGEKQLANWRP